MAAGPNDRYGCRPRRFHRGPTNARYRRVSLIAVRRREGRLIEPIAVAKPGSRAFPSCPEADLSEIRRNRDGNALRQHCGNERCDAIT